MKNKLLSLFILCIFVLDTLAIPVNAFTAPTSFDKPESFSVNILRYQDTLPDFTGFEATVSVPDNIRNLIDTQENPDSDFTTSGYYNLFVLLQLDFKTDSSDWHYTSDWNNEEKTSDQDFSTNLDVGNGLYTASTTYGVDGYLSKYFTTETPAFKSYFDTHTWQFRSRFVIKYYGSDGEVITFSPWSNTFAYSNKAIEDPAKLINHAPNLKSATLGTYANGQPYMTILTDKPHDDLEKLAAISTNTIRSEIWLKVGNADWKMARDNPFSEQLNFDAIDYFGDQENYKASIFQVKVRYSFNLNNYPQAGKTGIVYSPFSNVISQGLGAWSNASPWATVELQKASDAGLIPSVLKGTDMTKPITREEFAELAVLLYEKVSQLSSQPVSTNPFNDTTNMQILKAYQLGIVKGTSPTTFSPKTLINREQCATMLFRTIQAIAPDRDYSVTGVKNFPDQKNISPYAIEATKFMSKIGIIKGDASGNFMPKATTSLQTASGYGMATREASILMSVRTYDNMNNTSSVSNTIPQPKTPSTANSLIGVWSHEGTNGTLVDPSTGYITGSIYNGEWYLFRENATFRYVLVSSGQFISGGLVQEGKYTITGNDILLSTVKESWYPNPAATGQTASYKNKTIVDQVHTYTLKDNGTTMVIDLSDTFKKS